MYTHFQINLILVFFNIILVRQPFSKKIFSRTLVIKHQVCYQHLHLHPAQWEVTGQRLVGDWRSVRTRRFIARLPSSAPSLCLEERWVSPCPSACPCPPSRSGLAGGRPTCGLLGHSSTPTTYRCDSWITDTTVIIHCIYLVSVRWTNIWCFRFPRVTGVCPSTCTRMLTTSSPTTWWCSWC